MARVALEGLVKDGRIHPASIEEYVKRAQEEIDLTTTQAGEDAVARLNINGLATLVQQALGLDPERRFGLGDGHGAERDE